MKRNKLLKTAFTDIIFVHTHITGLEVGFLSADQERCITNGSVSVLHLLILFLIFVL